MKDLAGKTAFITGAASGIGLGVATALAQAGVAPEDVSEVILGQILTAAQGQNPGRQAAIKAGIPVETPAYLVNQLCGSGLRAFALGYQSIRNGDASIIVAGGQESMSMAPHAAFLRNGQKMGSLEFVDTMLKDGLTDAFNNIHMGITAEYVAREYQITREEQDRFAVASQNKAEAARKAGRFKDEIVPVTVKERKGERVVADNPGERTAEHLASLQERGSHEREHPLPQLGWGDGDLASADVDERRLDVRTRHEDRGGHAADDARSRPVRHLHRHCAVLRRAR